MTSRREQDDRQKGQIGPLGNARPPPIPPNQGAKGTQNAKPGRRRLPRKRFVGTKKRRLIGCMLKFSYESERFEKYICIGG